MECIRSGETASPDLPTWCPNSKQTFSLYHPPPRYLFPRLDNLKGFIYSDALDASDPVTHLISHVLLVTALGFSQVGRSYNSSIRSFDFLVPGRSLGSYPSSSSGLNGEILVRCYIIFPAARICGGDQEDFFLFSSF